MEENSFYLKALVENQPKLIIDIYRKNFPSIKRFILQNRGSAEDAEDIFQKALLQLAIRYRKEKFEIRGSFEGYLFKVCSNLWRRELNKLKVKVTNGEFIEPKDDYEDALLAILEQKRWEVFSENLEKISSNCNKILKMYFAKESYSNIVEKLKYSSETVARQRVFKCKVKLKELIIKDKRYKDLFEV